MMNQIASEKTSEDPKSISFKVVVFGIFTSESKRLEYGVRIEQVQEIGVVEQITRVPGAPPFVKGVMNLRGKIISVIDVKEKLGIRTQSAKADAADYQNTRVMVVNLKSNLVGLLVDDVDNVVEILASEVEVSPEIISESAPYFKGIAKQEGRLIMLLDIPTFIESDKNNDGVKPDPVREAGKEQEEAG